jgi:hypothetical protein
MSFEIAVEGVGIILQHGKIRKGELPNGRIDPDGNREFLETVRLR